METPTHYEAPPTTEVPSKVTNFRILDSMDHFWDIPKEGRYATFRRDVDPTYNMDVNDGPTLQVPRYQAESILRESDGKPTGYFYRRYVEQYAQGGRIIRLMETINERMNEYANEAGLCSQYDEAVEALNGIIASEYPEWLFRFSPRESMYRCVVERSVRQYTTVYVTARSNATASDLEEMAIEDANMADEWETDDGSSYSETLTEYEIAD